MSTKHMSCPKNHFLLEVFLKYSKDFAGYLLRVSGRGVLKMKWGVAVSAFVIGQYCHDGYMWHLETYFCEGLVFGRTSKQPQN